MILKGSQRGYGAQLAQHLLNAEDNEHIEVHEVRGFLADDLAGAFAEIEAVALGTKCRQPFFSVSINPPAEGSAQLTDKDFRAAVHRIEQAHGLQGQPRAIVFHEKDGRRHAHVVFSRIDAQTMTAKNLSHFKRRLMGISKELFLEHGFDLPDGFQSREQAMPERVDLAEWQAAKRRGRNGIDQKRLIRQCWAASDSKAAFQAALLEHGFGLARGDRRSHVVVTADGQIIAVARAVGIKTKEVRARLGEAEDLPGVETAQAALVEQAKAQFTHAARQVRAGLADARKALDGERKDQIAAHREERAALKTRHAKARAETVARLKQGKPGLSGLWERLTRAGDRRRTMREALDRLDTQQRAEWQTLRHAQLTTRRTLEAKRADLRREAMGVMEDIRADRAVFLESDPETGQTADRILQDRIARQAKSDPRQHFVDHPSNGPVSDADIRANPERLLERLSYFEASFSERDMSRELAKVFQSPLAALNAKRQVLASFDLVAIDGQDRRFTTRAYIQADRQLQSACHALSMKAVKPVAKRHFAAALAKQERALRASNATLSGEQRAAVTHMLNSSRLSMVVGRAGTGKSTILAAAKDGWAASEIVVHGAALSGKAAAGLQDASGIQSRTLASLELSWANGNDPVKPGEVLVVDEAGMVGTRQLARIATKMDEIGAKLVLVGDPDQLPAIEAGEPFRGMVARYGAAWLTQIHRQRSGWQRAATNDLAEGRVLKATRTYRAKGRVTDALSRDVAIIQLTEDYLQDRATAPESSRLILAHRRRDVYALNQSIRETMKAAEGLEGGPLLTTDLGPREISPSDRIVFTANDREIGVKNGMLGTVVKATEGSVIMDLDDGGRVRFDPSAFRSYDHGYAVTIHKSQGVTVDTAFVLASRSMDDPLAYVAMTRHRADMRLYVAGEDRPSWTQEPQDPRAVPSQQRDRRRSLEL